MDINELELDAGGPPYGIGRDPIDYGRAIDFTLSKHPSRVLANTGGFYRYGRFSFPGTGAVDVTMMGQHIATFTPAGVRLWSRGYPTLTTVEALSNLVTGGWFYRDKNVLYFEHYGQRVAPEYRPVREAFVEGSLFPYVKSEAVVS